MGKPGAAQSTFYIGLVGPPRNTPDYFALRVMNNLFGEQFQVPVHAQSGVGQQPGCLVDSERQVADRVGEPCRVGLRHRRQPIAE